MNEKLPIFEALDDAESHAERAKCLLAMPFSFVMTYQSMLRNRCHNRHFPEGCAYVDAVCVFLRAVRDEGGMPKAGALLVLKNANEAMAAIAHPPGGEGETV